MRSRRADHLLVLMLGLACMSTSITRAAGPVEALKTCAKMTDRDARLACYDKLGKRVLSEESGNEALPSVSDAQSKTSETTETESTNPSLPDDIGGADFEEQSQSTKNQDKGLITSCKKGADKRWYFSFDNGQIWKESNKGRRRFKECNFIATITRDGFGYRMQIEGETMKIRVSRVR